MLKYLGELKRSHLTLFYVLLLSLIALLLLQFNKDFSSRRILMLIDALGLGLFTASGVGIALEMKTPILPAAFIGVITATFGGVLRDILSNQNLSCFSRLNRFTQPALSLARGYIF